MKMSTRDLHTLQAEKSGRVYSSRLIVCQIPSGIPCDAIWPYLSSTARKSNQTKLSC